MILALALRHLEVSKVKILEKIIKQEKQKSNKEKFDYSLFTTPSSNPE